MPTKFCPKCRRTLDDSQFYGSNNLEKHPDGKMTECKKCATMHVNNWEPETFLPLLEEADVPFIQEEWKKMVDKYCTGAKKVTGLTVIGRYLSKTKLTQYSKLRWVDTERLNEENKEKIAASLEGNGDLSDEEKEKLINSDLGEAPAEPEEAVELDVCAAQLEEEDAAILKDLTEDDIKYLRIEWGGHYRPSQWVKLEKFSQEMQQSYDIQTAAHMDNLKLVCKASLRVHELIDMGDVDGAVKAGKLYDQLMKSGKFTAAQNKEEHKDELDSVSELALLCEKEGGFIPTFYDGQPKDCVDKTLEDFKRYTYNLVTKEQGLGNLIEAALKTMKEESEKEDIIESDNDEDEALEEVMEDVENEEPLEPEKEMSEEDYTEYQEFIHNEREGK